MSGHHADERRPEEGLAEAVEGPKGDHDARLGEDGHEEIAYRRRQHADDDEAAGRDAVADEATDQLAEAVGEEEGGTDHTGLLTGDVGGGDQLGDDSAVVDAGEVAGEIDGGAEQDEALSGPPGHGLGSHDDVLSAYDLRKMYYPLFYHRAVGVSRQKSPGFSPPFRLR